MDWVLSVTTLICIELNVRKVWWSYLLALANQVVWTIFIVTSQKWGLLPLNIALYIMNTRAAIRWYALHKEGKL